MTTALASHVRHRSAPRSLPRGRVRGAAAVHDGHLPDRVPRHSRDALARARADRIVAEHRLATAIRDAERAYRDAERLGQEVDRRLARSRARLRDAGYLQR